MSVNIVGLWLALRYFVVAVPAAERGRGAITMLLASIASFYSFAHTAGAEATTAITWFALFGVGIRVLQADLAIVAACIFGVGLVVYVATCICNLSQPRYVLPFWVGTVASGCLLIAGRGIDFRLAEEQDAAH